MPNALDFRHLAVFERVARLGSMAKAAAALGVSQPTVSARVSDLEAAVGTPLFRRNAGGTELNQAGRRFLPYAERCLALYEEGRRVTRVEARRQELRIAAPASLAEVLFPVLGPILVDQGFDLSLSNDHSPQVLEMLLDGRVDIGVCGPAPVVPALTAVPLPPIPVVCVAHCDHDLARRRPRSFGLREVAPWIALFEWSAEVEDLRQRLAVATNGDLHGYLKVSPGEVARRLVLTANAIAFLPWPLVATELDSGSLVAVNPRGCPSYRWELVLVHRTRDADDPAIRAVAAAAAALLRVDAFKSAPGDKHPSGAGPAQDLGQRTAGDEA